MFHQLFRPAYRCFWTCTLIALVAPSLAVGEPTSRQPTPPAEVFNTKAILPATANGLATAMGVPAANLVSADLGATDPDGVGIGNSALGLYFPIQGSTFAILATGLATSAELPNDSESTSSGLDGLNNSQGNDMVQLRLTLAPPTTADCLAFDFAYYSEEFPEFVGSQFNDGFIAELGGSDFQIINNQIVAPLNFAFDSDGNPISVNTVFGVTEPTASTYDGVTPLLRAVTPLEPSAFPQVELVLTITDLGDSIYDSAVFLDNFAWLSGVNCDAGAQADTDGDALLDDWEMNGVDVDGDGTIDLDLPAMGADPMRKDIFVEVDYMVQPGVCNLGTCIGGHSHKPKTQALQIAIDTFANAPVSNPDGSMGINLHIDAGPGTIMDPVTGATWGARSRSDVLAHDNSLGTGLYNWTEFDQIKGVGSTPGNFSITRRDVFHYSVFGHNLGNTSISGISRGISASDFIVTLGSWTGQVGTVNEQAGTFLHELGHNLALRHGGSDDYPYKPNYLSVMNYWFQMRGRRMGGLDGNFDYSAFVASTLNEANLDETAGIGGVPAGLGARYFCIGAELDDSLGAVDWNCDGDEVDTGVSQNINGAPGTVLTGFDDWDSLRFDGGAVGQLGVDVELPIETEADEITEEEDAEIPTPFAVSLGSSAGGMIQVLSGTQSTLEIRVTNAGDNPDSYLLDATSVQGWAAVGNLPGQVGLDSGASTTLQLAISIPGNAAPGAQDRVRIELTSAANPAMMDSLELELTVVDEAGGSVWEFSGIAQGGTVSFSVAGVALVVTTQSGQTAAQVASLVADAVNGDATLAAAGIGAVAFGNRVLINGDVSAVDITDPGIDHTSGDECVASDENLCLNGNRFEVNVVWRDFAGATGSGQVVPFGSDDSGLFYFFSEDNWEMLIKVLDGCGINDRFWVFSAATTDVEYTLTVTDTMNDSLSTYFNPLGNAAAAITDTDAFDTCPAAGAPLQKRSVRLDRPAAGVIRGFADKAGDCTPSNTNLCLQQDRFHVEVTWRDFAGATGPARVVPFGSDDSGLFYFFSEDNWEMLIKVLDGCEINDRLWVFSAATTDVEYTLTVTDTMNDVVSTYFNPLGTAAPAITDTDAFDTCP